MSDEARPPLSGDELQAMLDHSPFIAFLGLKVTEADPVVKGQTAASSYKHAKLENGVTINVPEFIGTGERVRVNPSTGEYLDRAKD